MNGVWVANIQSTADVYSNYVIIAKMLKNQIVFKKKIRE